jgi:hypothetical protein
MHPDQGPEVAQLYTNPEAIGFLLKLRRPPWILFAIEPNGPIFTGVAHTPAEADIWVTRNKPTCNLYFQLNAAKPNIKKKPEKDDIVAVEYFHADLDPVGNETPEQAKARYQEALKSGVAPAPTFLIDTGNGLQPLWRRATARPLGEGAERIAAITDIEARNWGLVLRLGCDDPSTRNIDRILRLPGTTNYPTKAKLAKGRVECPARLLAFNDVSYPDEPFRAWGSDQGPGCPGDGGHHARQRDPDDSQEDELWRTIRDGGGKRHGPTRSEAVWWVVNEMLRRGYAPTVVTKVLLNKQHRISDHVYEQSNPPEYAQRQVSRARDKITFTESDSGVPHKTSDNICIAFLKMGVRFRYDRFADRKYVDGLDGFGPVLDDDAVIRLRRECNRRFKFLPSKDMLFDTIRDVAQLNKFHPVLDYLHGLQWDGVPRLNEWLITYGNAEPTDYVRAVGALILKAAVARVRRPGCKFDEMVVLEGSQGTNKSSALQILAVEESWFSDSLPLRSLSEREVIEQLRGRWLIEAAEMSGHGNADTEHIKAFLSRTHDRARMAYAREQTEAPRQCVIIGTTNKEEYLPDTTGNRRFWPVRTNGFDLEALKHDRDQLWAEAAARVAKGESIRLAKELWPSAAAVQKNRSLKNPFYDQLFSALADIECGKIATDTIFVILDIRGRRSQKDSQNVGEVMRVLDWFQNKAGQIKIGGKSVTGWAKGEEPWPEIEFFRDKGNVLMRGPSLEV